MKTRWFLPLEIRDSQLRSTSIEIHAIVAWKKRNVNSAVANVDVREIICQSMLE